MFERFTEKAIKTIMLAQEEARRLGHNFVSPEFLLLGMIGEGTGLAAISLKNFGITLKGARQTVEKHLGRGSGFVSVEIPFTPPAKKSLEASWYAARELGHNYIGTEHLLIGVMETDDATCLQILEELQLDREKVKADVRGRIARFPNQERPLESQSGQTESPKGFPAAEAASPRSRASAVKIPCIECGELISPKAARCLFCNAGFDDELFKKCPYCAESVRKAAIKCRWCQSDLSSADV